MGLTAEQAAAVRAPERSIAVVAGAGTGKTRVLTERYLHLVRERGVDVARILAVTFTEKAAREMKDRIRKALLDAPRPDLARDAEFAPVSTIHAFLARVLRERALDVGLDPRYVIADEMTAQLLLEEALQETIDGLDGSTRGALVDLEGGEESLLALYHAARATPHPMRALRLAEPDLEDLRVRMGRFLDECAAQRATAAGTARKLAGIAALAEQVRRLDPAAAEEFAACVKGGVAPAQRDLFVAGKRLASEYAALALLPRGRATGAAVVVALDRLDDLYGARKREQGLLDFADLERRGLALLRGSAGAAVCAEFDHLLVDEYQDTNRLQEAILDRLAEHAERFGVGDEKQSIYRFRHADAGVFQELQDKAATYPLGGSFRSRPELVQFTNAVFEVLFEGTGVRPQSLHAAAQWRPAPRPCVEVLRPAARNAADGRRKEAQAVARRIRDIVEGREILHSRADRPPEPLAYRDCALLLRATSHLVIYERAFVDAGVPYAVIQGRGYYAAREVVDLAHLLLLLADPDDEYRAVAALTSLFCGVPEADLLALPREGPWPFRVHLAGRRPDSIPSERWATLQAFAERFARWRILAGRVETGDLVETIFAETRFADLMLLEPDGRRRHANLMKALRRARQSKEDYVTYARSLLEFRERELRESEAPIAAESDEAVKIMTIHAAKGLEFPLVVVGDLAAGKRGVSGPLLRPDGVFSIRLRDESDRGAKPPGYAELSDGEKVAEYAEELRLLYVAFTRAEEHLILSGARTGRENGALSRLPSAGQAELDPEPLLRRDPRRRRGAAVRAALRRRADLPPSVPRDDGAARDLLARLDARVPPEVDGKPYVAAVADLVEFQRCPRRYSLKRMLGIEFESDEGGREPADAEELPRRELGTVFHELMKVIGPGAVPEPDVIESVRPGATVAEIDKIRRWCAWLARQAFVRELEGVKQHREMPFLARIAGQPVRGVVDLYVPSLPRLLDYKTGSKVRAEEYAVQVAVYLAALRGLGFPAPERAQLVYVDAETVVDIAAEPVEPLVERFVAAHAGAGAFPPVPSQACLHCEFRRACARNGVAVPRQTGLFE